MSQGNAQGVMICRVYNDLGPRQFEDLMRDELMIANHLIGIIRAVVIASS